MNNFLKGIIFIAIYTWYGTATALIIDPAFLPLLSSENLLNIVRLQDAVSLVEQVGQELFVRDYLSTYIIIQTVLGASDERPANAPNGYSLDTGQWVWLPVSSGEWLFIERDYTRYILFMQGYLQSINV